MQRLNRRDALRLSGLALGGAAVAAAAPSPALATDCAPAALALGTGTPLSTRLVQALVRADRAAARARQAPPPDPSFQVLTRRPGQPPESMIEKPVVVPAPNDRDPGHHAWAEARFWTDIMAEHALFIAMLIPPGTGETELGQALSFANQFLRLNQRLGAMSPPGRGELRGFVARVVDPILHFAEYKARLGEEQSTGRIRSLAWPLFYREARLEAERAARRLTQLAGGNAELDRAEVVAFWVENMEGHARLTWHLLDPDESALIQQAMQLSQQGRELLANPGPALQEPGLSTVVALGQTVIDFKTEGVRGIEAAQIKSIIDPRMADHMRREAVKFADELKRVV